MSKIPIEEVIIEEKPKDDLSAQIFYKTLVEMVEKFFADHPEEDAKVRALICN